MYDSYDCASDLRDLAYHCQELVTMEKDLQAIRYQIETLTVSGGIVKVSRDKNATYHEGHDQELFFLMEREEMMKINYSALRAHMRKVCRVLALMNLDELQLKALRLKYEKNLSYEGVGQQLFCSAGKAWMIITELTNRFAEIYNSLPEISRRTRR